MGVRPHGDEAGGGSVEDGLTPVRSASGVAAPLGEADTEPGSAAGAPGRSGGRTPGAELDLERAAARAKLKASLFQIESAPLSLGRFTILARLGQGGMGVVYSAYDEDLDRKVAVKVMLPDAGSDTARDRMRREAQAMARLSHPNIVTVHEVGTLDGQVFIAMEFVRGQSLDQWLQDEDRAWPSVLDVFVRAGRGLHAAHEAGLVHRDFKPQNVMVGDDGSIKVLDFGLARAERSLTEPAGSESESESESGSGALLDETLTRTGALVGTPAFMAPEQHGAGSITARSDQFSFCVALHMALHGEHPFGGDSLPALMAAVCEGRRRPTEGGRVPAWIDAVLGRGMSVEPDERYPSMAALLDALSLESRSRRRRRATAAVVVLGVFGGGFALAQLGGVAGQACPDGQEQLVGVWDDERRSAVVEGLARSGSAWAKQVQPRLLPVLDRYAQGWAASRQSACERLRSHQISDLMHDRQVGCLDRAKAALSTVVEQLQGADAPMVDKAMAAASGLPLVSRCEDPAVVLAPIEPPADAIADEVVGLRQQLSRSRVLEDLGRIDDGRDLVTEVVERAETLGYRPLSAEALVRRGSIEVTAMSVEAAEASLDRALWLAVEIGHDSAAAEAAARRLFVRSELLRRPSEAVVEVPWARALVARTGDDALRGLVRNNEAAIYMRQGLTDEALPLLEESIEAKQAALGPEHPEVGMTRFNQGYTLHQRGTSGLAIEPLRQAEAIFEASLGPWHPFRVRTLMLLGSILRELGRYAEAEVALATVDALYEHNPTADQRLGVDRASAKADLWIARRRWPEAEQASRDGLEQARALYGEAPNRLASFRWRLARALAGQGQVDEAETLLEQTVASLRDASGGDGEPSDLLISTWVERAMLRLSAGQAERAEQAVEQAEQLARVNTSLKTPVDQAWRDHLRGRAALLAGDRVRAEPLLRKSLEVIEAREEPTGVHRLDAQEAVGQLWWAQGDAARSAEVFAQQEAALAEHRAADDPRLAWVRACRARARYAAEASARAEAFATARAAHDVLAAEPGWAVEAGEVSAWLAEHEP